jgi:predicted cupin superfamily sugar epimerase
MNRKGTMKDGQYWVRDLDLEPHPEGGYFRRIYTAENQVPTATGPRPVVTSIYYLMDHTSPRGRIHRNRSDILHYHLQGDPMEYVLINEHGELHVERLGGDGAQFMLVPGGTWKGSRLVVGASYALIAEVVTPGFDFADHDFATATDLGDLASDERVAQYLTEMSSPHLPL